MLHHASHIRLMRCPKTITWSTQNPKRQGKQLVSIKDNLQGSNNKLCNSKNVLLPKKARHSARPNCEQTLITGPEISKSSTLKHNIILRVRSALGPKTHARDWSTIKSYRKLYTVAGANLGRMHQTHCSSWRFGGSLRLQSTTFRSCSTFKRVSDFLVSCVRRQCSSNV